MIKKTNLKPLKKVSGRVSRIKGSPNSARALYSRKPKHQSSNITNKGGRKD